MRAVMVSRFGAADLVDAPVPVAGTGEVRIRVAAAAVNPVDVQTCDGVLPVPRERLPIGLGWDVAGTIDAVGADVTQFRVGDPVVGLEDRLVKDLGSFAEFVVLSAVAVAAAPRSVDLVAASTLPLNALTAWQALELIGSASTLLVTGAAGAVGGYSVELAAARGLHVVALADAFDEQVVRGWGARTFLARSDDPARAVRAMFPTGIDAVLDAAHLREQALAAVRDGGTYVNLAPLLPPVTAQRGIRVRDQAIRHDGPQLAELARLVDAGRLTPRVAKTVPLTEAAAALALTAKGGLRGRPVLAPTT
jgi:NADPH:quinone reductase